jgi:hypothetical protein
VSALSSQCAQHSPSPILVSFILLFLLGIFCRTECYLIISEYMWFISIYTWTEVPPATSLTCFKRNRTVVHFYSLKRKIFITKISYH